MSVMDRPPKAASGAAQHQVSVTPVPAGVHESVSYAESQLTAVHVNLPKLLWQAVDAMANRLATTKTNIVVRALNKEAFFNRVHDEDPGAKVVVEHSNGDREYVNWV